MSQKNYCDFELGFGLFAIGLALAIVPTGLGSIVGFVVGNNKDMDLFNHKNIDTHDKYAGEYAGYGALIGFSSYLLLIGIGLLIKKMVDRKNPETASLVNPDKESCFSWFKRGIVSACSGEPEAPDQESLEYGSL